MSMVLPCKNVVPESIKKAATEELPSPRRWLLDVYEFARQDPKRVTFALKVGLACLLVSLLILFRAPYEIFGTNIIWSILTVAIMFEYTVGTLHLSDDGSEHPEFSKTVMDDFPDEPAFRKCRATLNSSAKLDSLAISAKWEPPHGRFKHFFYPWAEYVKVGNVLRHCAYEVMALHGCVHSEIQAPYNLRSAFQSEILDATNQAAELLRRLAKDVGNMKWSLQTSLLKHVHISTERLQRSIDLHSYLLTSSHEVKLSKNTSLNLSNDQSSMLQQAESYHEQMKRQQRRLSWPSREVDDFEDDGNVVSDDLIPRMQALESTTALSLATFTSLLIEFVARLDHLVEAVEKLAKMAKFMQHAN